MNGARKQAWRYHWLSEGLRSFVDDPHAAIDRKGQGEIVNLEPLRGPEPSAHRCRALAANRENRSGRGPQRQQDCHEAAVRSHRCFGHRGVKA
jgi:hypothetical protein